MHCFTTWGVVGNGTPCVHRLTASGPWALELLPFTLSLLRGNGQWKPCGAVQPFLGQWAVELLWYIAGLPRGSGQWNFFYALPWHLGAMGIRRVVL